MKIKQLFTGILIGIMAVSVVGCGAKEEAVSTEEVMTINEEQKEITMLCEVNGTYFTEPTRHGIVFKDGSNGEKAVLRGLADEKEFHQYLLDIGAEPGNNLTSEDMKAGADNGVAVEGEKIDMFIKWEGQEEIPFEDIIVCSEGDYDMDMRFGGNLESAKENNTGCVVCLDSCATGIISDATWPTGVTQNKTATFTGNEAILPEDGTTVTVTFRLAE